MEWNFEGPEEKGEAFHGWSKNMHDQQRPHRIRRESFMAEHHFFEMKDTCCIVEIFSVKKSNQRITTIEID